MDGKAVRRFVVTRREDVPESFVPLATFGPPGARVNGKRGSGTQEYAAIQSAWKNGRISGCSYVRSPGDRSAPVFVDRDQAQRLLGKSRDNKAKAEQAAIASDARAVNIDGAGIVAALRSILFELRRIGNTLETISQRAAVAEAAAIAEDAAGEWDSPDRE